MTPLNAMRTVRRILSSILLASGIVLVFAGLSAALGFNVSGIIASVGAIAALLYAGGTWLLPPSAVAIPGSADTILVFDRDLHVTVGPGAGLPLLSKYPSALRPEIETRCRAALRGESSSFVCDIRGTRVVFEAAPLASSTGVIVYGTLITSTGVSVLSLSARPLTTVA